MPTGSWSLLNSVELYFQMHIFETDCKRAALTTESGLDFQNTDKKWMYGFKDNIFCIAALKNTKSFMWCNYSTTEKVHLTSLKPQVLSSWQLTPLLLRKWQQCLLLGRQLSNPNGFARIKFQVLILASQLTRISVYRAGKDLCINWPRGELYLFFRV